MGWFGVDLGEATGRHPGCCWASLVTLGGFAAGLELIGVGGVAGLAVPLGLL